MHSGRNCDYYGFENSDYIVSESIAVERWMGNKIAQVINM